MAIILQNKSTVSIDSNAIDNGVCVIVDTGRIHHTFLFVEFKHLAKFREANFENLSPVERAAKWSKLIEAYTVTVYLANHGWHTARGDKNNATKARSLLKVANTPENSKTETSLPQLDLDHSKLSRSKTSVFETSINYAKDRIGSTAPTNDSTSSKNTEASFRTAQHLKSVIVQDLKDVVAEHFKNKELHAVFW